MLELTSSNYYSLEAESQYMGVHQFAAWSECGAREWARQHGDYTPPDKQAFLVGSYVDKGVLTPDLLQTWISDNAAEIYQKSGKAMLAPFVKADAMIARLLRDAAAVELLRGRKQVILTGFIGADHEGRPVAWKGAADNLNDGIETETDLKTCKSFEQEWSDEVKKRVDWYEVFNYWRQRAVYQELILQMTGKVYLPSILAVTKQDPPDIGCWVFDDADRLGRELEAVKNGLPNVMAMKAGVVAPARCGKCDYCRGTNKLEVRTAQSWR
jgi:hypothetical protein